MQVQGNFSRQQKIGLGLLVVVAGATFVLGVLRIRNIITAPSSRRVSDYKSLEQREQEKIERLKAQDIDGDGIHDYDELHVFRTSPFLDDSDSDGVSDGVEIAQETDPNCPKGKTCGEVRSSSVPGTAVPGSNGSAVPGTAVPGTGGTGDAAILRAVEGTFGDISALTPEQLAEKLKAMPPLDLRAFLVKIGIPKNALDKADDDTLRELLLETLTELGKQSG